MTTNRNHKKNVPLWLKIGRLKLYAVLVIVAAVIIAVAVIVRSCGDTSVDTEVDDHIGLTPMQVLSMREIGQWEFLSIEDEEMVDTVRKGFFRNDVLTRIYFGTLRLGFDMRSVKDNWIQREADTLHVTLPPIVLLDDDFIDEARTQSFYEQGSWTDKDRAALYKRAREKMLKRCMTTDNIRSAEANALRQVHQMLRSMGFENVRIRFELPESLN